MSLWYGLAFVQGPARLQQGLVVVGSCAVLAGVSAAVGGADTASTFRQRAADLRDANAAISQRVNGALLGLYALDAKLDQAHARLDALRAQAARIRAKRDSARRQLAAAQQTLRISQRRLAMRVHALYEQGGTDPLAAILGAGSIDEAITSLDDLNRSAELDRRISRETAGARARLRTLSRSLARRDSQVQTLTASAETTLASLGTARSARQAYLANLAGEQRLNTAQIARLDARALASVQRGHLLSPAPAPAPAPSAPAREIVHVVSHTLTVTASGYSLDGATATGIPVGWGTVAVDPSLIPLGTRLAIPGYGEGVAADTGPAVQGAAIDLWFPTPAEAIGWGRRTITITLH
jgi:3D (Asp-Asp-Asp) domain-containing protein/peptidoglycan hydrolase CwlO-like protein